jgi:hypothetical protein
LRSFCYTVCMKMCCNFLKIRAEERDAVASAEYDGHAVRRTMGLNGVHPSRFVKRNVCLQETCFPDESVLVVIEVY